ncbi:MAG TPA: tetratricopeptide repeat protein, partial [Rhizomicrobium sp.]|nr:tetratricopeptide repeat protein [Rhizomicrobium sp.]
MPNDAAANDDAEIDRISEASRAIRPLRDSRLREAAQALNANRPDIAGQVLSEFLRAHPRDADALNLMGDAALRLDRKIDAEEWLARCVAEAPGFDAARFNYADALRQMNKPVAAMAQLDVLLEKAPRNPLYRDLKAVLLAALGHHADSLACRRALVEDYPNSANALVTCAHALRTMGFQDECIAAYRKAIGISPTFGIAWWGLANLKMFRFAATDIERMEEVLAGPGLAQPDRVRLLFALGKAHGDLARYEASFQCYAKGNAIRRLGVNYDPDVTTLNARRYKELFTPEFFRDRTGSGSAARDPIFVVGLQRSGSTLVEQILA